MNGLAQHEPSESNGWEITVVYGKHNVLSKLKIEKYCQEQGTTQNEIVPVLKCLVFFYSFSCRNNYNAV